MNRGLLLIPGFRSAQRRVADVPAGGRYAGALQRRLFSALTGERIVLSELSNPAAKASDGIVYRLYQP